MVRYRTQLPQANCAKFASRTPREQAGVGPAATVLYVAQEPALSATAPGLRDELVELAKATLRKGEVERHSTLLSTSGMIGEWGEPKLGV